MRIKSVVMDMIEVGKFIEYHMFISPSVGFLLIVFANIAYRSCFEWESTLRSSIAFAVFLLVTWHFEPYLIPLGLLLAFVRHYMVFLVFNF